MEGVLDLNDLCLEDEAATFFVRASGASMIRVGIHDGNLLVVNRAREAKDQDLVIAAMGSDLTVKRLVRKEGRCWPVDCECSLPPNTSAHGPHYSNAAGGTPTEATSHTPMLSRAARQGVEAIYRDQKAGATLYELVPEAPEQPSLFTEQKDPRENALRAAIDQINGSWESIPCGWPLPT